MTTAIVRSPGERVALIVIAAIGGLGLNGVFLYVAANAALRERALSDPLAWALMIEALIVTGLLAWVFARRAIGRLGAGWFWVLSLLGGLAFSVPVAFLSGAKEGDDGA